MKRNIQHQQRQRQPEGQKQDEEQQQQQQTHVMHEVTPPTRAALLTVDFNQRTYTKRIKSPEDLSNWKRSLAYYDVIAYINNTSMSIQGYRQDGANYTISKQILKLSKIFDWLDGMLYKCHPLGADQGLLRCVGNDRMLTMEPTNLLQRKCHHAFRRWSKLVQEKIFWILERQVAPNCRHINELAQYLSRSFGNPDHSTYGPANELMFVFYLCGLFKSGILNGDDTIAAVLQLFQHYLDMVRRLVTFYRLAPTYKRDHSTIDDHNILPYIWGCAQLCRNQAFAPPKSEDPAISEKYRQSYMLISSLHHLGKTMGDKALGVHSYQLWCALSLSNWPDVYAGLMGSYVKHVLNDFYIVQDLIFSEMMSFDRQPLEYILRAHLGELPKQDTAAIQSELTESNDSVEDGEAEAESEAETPTETEAAADADADANADAEGEVGEDDLAHYQEMALRQQLSKKETVKERPAPPVALFKPRPTDVYVGFCDPRGPHAAAADDDDDKEPRQPRLQRLRPVKDQGEKIETPWGLRNSTISAQSADSDLDLDQEQELDRPKKKPNQQKTLFQTGSNERILGANAGSTISGQFYS